MLSLILNISATKTIWHRMTATAAFAMIFTAFGMCMTILKAIPAIPIAALNSAAEHMQSYLSISKSVKYLTNEQKILYKESIEGFDRDVHGVFAKRPNGQKETTRIYALKSFLIRFHAFMFADYMGFTGRCAEEIVEKGVQIWKKLECLAHRLKGRPRIQYTMESWNAYTLQPTDYSRICAAHSKS